MKKITNKHAKELREYNKLRKEYLARQRFCPVMLKIYKKYVNATEIHHKRGRGKYLNDISTWIAVSRDGHQWIHENTRGAIENGWTTLHGKVD